MSLRAQFRTTWRKSSYSSTNGGECVEVAATSNEIGVRDSKDPDGSKVVLDRASFRRLVNEIRTGGHDL